MKNTIIVEEKLGIPPDYQYKALKSKNFVQSNWHNNKLAVLDTILGLTRAKKVLDLGTGSGIFELKFANKLHSITGIDYNNQAVLFLQKKLKQRKIKNVRLLNLNIKDVSKKVLTSKYDLIIIVDVIEHIKMSEAATLVSKLKEFLTPGGYVCIITPNYKGLWPIIERVFDTLGVVPHMGNEQHLSKFYPKNLNSLFKKTGYEHIYSSTFNLFSFLIPFRNLSVAMCKIELKLNLKISNLALGLYKYS